MLVNGIIKFAIAYKTNGSEDIWPAFKGEKLRLQQRHKKLKFLPYRT